VPTSSELSLEELIDRAGYAASRAAYMKLVVQCAIETLQHAEAQLNKDWFAFCAKKGATRRPRKGAKNKTVRPDENAITYELGDYVNGFLRNLPVEHPFRQVRFDFECPTKSKRLAGSRRKRLDLRFEAFHPGGPEFVIEAKRLLALADVTNRYLGDEGLGRFVREEEPLTRDQLGALLGYVPQSSASTWRKAIRDATVAVDGCDLMVNVTLGSWDKTYSSRHGRPASLSPLWILHLFVKYPELPQVETAVSPKGEY